MIKGLIPQVVEGGKIKLGGLGEEKTSRAGKKWRAPVKYESFQITTTRRTEAGDLIIDDPIMAILPTDADGHLRAIPVVVHSDEIEEIFLTCYARYAGKKLHCSGDGEQATRWELILRDGHTIRTGQKKQCKCPCKFQTDDPATCKPHAIFNCSIRVPGLAVAGAVHTLRTTSIITIKRITGSLLQIKATVGLLRGLPLTLVVQPVQTDKGVVYCAHVELRAADIQAAQREALEARKLQAALLGEIQVIRPALQAPATEDESDEEQAAVAAEFQPDNPGNHVEVLKPVPMAAGEIPANGKRKSRAQQLIEDAAPAVVVPDGADDTPQDDDLLLLSQPTPADLADMEQAMREPGEDK